ncbi:histidine N-acetyltransferase-like isoform X1 [Astyanax mexicanus]|uniref:Histidine N-acetyltransferase-like n=2 Tax=Astyanax mexicanus TaxID=7994 RepID=A0A8B9RFY7_ASTMX|nr:histidine N-acetyltransferase-like isoform X1 [Astyanax mexicanus]
MEAQCVGESDGLTFWLARPQDYDEVMAISHGIYAGNDYLPHRYHIWMTEKDRVTIIARRDGKLTALESGIVVDEGKSVVVEGLRVCPSERGRGVAGVIQKVTDRYIKQIYPSVNIKRLTRGDDPGPEKLSKFIFLARRAVLSLCGEAEKFNNFVLGLKAKLDSIEKTEQSTTNNQLTVLKDDQQLKAILLDPDLSTRLQLPGGAIIQDWLPLKPLESNLEILKRKNLTWLADTSNDKLRFLSFHTPPYPVPFNGGSLRLNIDLYGEDLRLARKALITHLEQVMGELRGTVPVHIYMPQTLWAGMQKFCEGDEGVKQIHKYWEQLFLERELS